MRDRLIYGLIPGLLAPFLIILLFWVFRFRYLSLEEFIHQAIFLKVHFKLIAIGVFFADLGLFYLLLLRFNKNNASKGVIMAVFLYFFVFLISSF